jgi:hypothetical protein
LDTADASIWLAHSNITTVAVAATAAAAVLVVVITQHLSRSAVLLLLLLLIMGPSVPRSNLLALTSTCSTLNPLMSQPPPAALPLPLLLLLLVMPRIFVLLMTVMRVGKPCWLNNLWVLLLLLMPLKV